MASLNHFTTTKCRSGYALQGKAMSVVSSNEGFLLSEAFAIYRGITRYAQQG